MPSIRYASLDEYWPAVRARAFAAEVRSLGGGPGFTTPRRLTYAKNMEILAKWAGVPVNHMPWVNPITFAERLCSAAFSSPAHLTKIMGKRAYSEMCYFHVNCSTNVLPENRLVPPAPEPQLVPPAPEPEEEQEPPAVRARRAEHRADAFESQLKACEAQWMTTMARAEEAEEQVCQLKKEVAQVHLADMIARDATARANLTAHNFLHLEQRAALADSNFVRLQHAISTVLYDADHVYHTKIYDEYHRASASASASASSSTST